jgi:subtilisin family serine protease
MVHDRASWRMKMRRGALALTAAVGCLGGSAVQAEILVRAPTISVPSHIPTIAPTIAPVVTPRVDPSIAARTVTSVGRTTPNLRTQQGCSAAYRDSSGDCHDHPASSTDGGSSNDGGSVNSKTTNNKTTNSKTTNSKTTNGNSDSNRNSLQTALDQNTVAKQIVAEIKGSVSDEQAREFGRRHGLERLQSQSFPLLGATIGLFRITDNRSVATVRRELATDANFGLIQPNFRYRLQDQRTALIEGDAAQYALAQLRLPQAHTLAHGANVTIAIIDSGIDVKHPELLNSIGDSFDALGSNEGPHLHGTGIAGAIVAHARLMGSAPEARVLAIRAFGTAPNGAESTSYVILKSLDYAAEHGAQIINMSFAGPRDTVIERAIAATAAKGIVLVAASGNAGPKSPPLYPAANPNVIAVSATDAQDKLFPASNRGNHIAIAAPGVEIFLPAPDEKYQMTSGTSFSAAYVSGIAALVLERNPALKPEEVRTVLTKTARDLGAPGRDDLFGAGEADAYGAVMSVGPAVPVAAVSDRPATEKVPDRMDAPVGRALNPPAAAMASDKSASGDDNRAPAQ